MMSPATLSAKQAFLLESWQRILNDPHLDQYENFRFETDGNGEILMSPRPPKSNNFKATKIATMLVARLGGEAAIEPQITIGQGVKVPDACWLLHALALGGRLREQAGLVFGAGGKIQLGCGISVFYVASCVETRPDRMYEMDG